MCHTRTQHTKGTSQKAPENKKQLEGHSINYGQQLVNN